MQLNEMTFDGATPIEGYGPGFFRIGGEAMEGAILVTVHGARGWGGYDDPDPLLALAGEVDVLFVGTGPETLHVPSAVRTRLEEAGLGVEAMNSPAAARSYNVLIAEGRRVAVALLPV
jgi:uncharacterized protein